MLLHGGFRLALPVASARILRVRLDRGSTTDLEETRLACVR